ncbi:hypothetical protein T4B_5009 [Trichinella pseudospiralis]|uniref:Uncharacterized protein n=1 Tax=Trichinella pseudospiralis TaxID=6337 RepID=A0A0V1JCB3_TRIPS|nr:hypothetical protein T4B_5009 [Trichinella pseudospiralis]
MVHRIFDRYTAVVNTCMVLCVMYFFHICTTLKWEDFIHRRKCWKYRDEEMKHCQLFVHHEITLRFCRILFGQMRRQIIDVTVGKRIYAGNGNSWKTKGLIMHWHNVAMMQRIKNKHF